MLKKCFVKISNKLQENFVQNGRTSEEKVEKILTNFQEIYQKFCVRYGSVLRTFRKIFDQVLKKCQINSNSEKYNQKIIFNKSKYSENLYFRENFGNFEEIKISGKNLKMFWGVLQKILQGSRGNFYHFPK